MRFRGRMVEMTMDTDTDVAAKVYLALTQCNVYVPCGCTMGL
jgi:hypothetical protein